MADIIDRFCTIPAKEKVKLFRQTLFNFLIGNEVMHFKNFSLIKKNEIVQISPAYDLLNSTIILNSATEELALPLKGKKSKLTRSILIAYFGRERLKLSLRVINSVLEKISSAIPEWERTIEISFRSALMKDKFQSLVIQRRNHLGI